MLSRSTMGGGSVGRAEVTFYELSNWSRIELYQLEVTLQGLATYERPAPT